MRNTGDANGVKQVSQLLREQLNEMMAAAQMLESILSEHEKGRGYLSVICRGMCRQLWTVYRLELETRLSGEDELRLFFQPVELVELCRSIVHRVDDLARQLGVRAEFSAVPKALSAIADPRALEDMLLLLLGNAVSAASSGDVISLELEQREKQAVLTLRDSGAGLGPEDVAVLTAEEDPEPGDLSGPALARRIFSLHGGRALAENKGACLMITLPVREEAKGGLLHSPRVDDGGWDRALAALSDALPSGAFLPEELN